MKYVILMILFPIISFASSGKNKNTISKSLIKNVIVEKTDYREISIIVGDENYSLINDSINNICLTRDIRCNISISEGISFKKIKLEIYGKESDIKNIHLEI